MNSLRRNLKRFIQYLLKQCLRVNLAERLYAISILERAYAELDGKPTFARRELLWEHILNEADYRARKINYIEFGVHQAYSIQYFAALNRCETSLFIGLDSFEGLPEEWINLPKGAFNLGGKIPQVDDPRIVLIKGWFQHTWDELTRQLSSVSGAENLIVHYDADLYSSTLFALTKIDSLNTPYIAIFDEFMSHEIRALYNYCQAFNARVEFLGKTRIDNRNPHQVACKIYPLFAQTTAAPGAI